MPCYTVNTVSLDFSAADRALLEKVVKSLKWKISGNLITTQLGTIALLGDKAVCQQALTPLVNQLRVAYAKAAVKRAAEKFGWKMTKKKGKIQLKKGGLR